jgi:hypothetical protein
MPTAHLNTNSITDWQSFHEACRDAFGFPDFYGMNMNAWIDCLTGLDEDDGLSRFHLAEGEALHIEVAESLAFKARLPDIFDALIECSVAVNERFAESGKPPVLSLILL